MFWRGINQRIGIMWRIVLSLAQGKQSKKSKSKKGSFPVRLLSVEFFKHY
jgi:hypothetical protein